MGDRVQEILGWYESDNPGTKTSLARLLNGGKLGGSGKLVILPVAVFVKRGDASREQSAARRAQSVVADCIQVFPGYADTKTRHVDVQCCSKLA